jgi:peptidoglycan/xylan/chitin deacetylase (PgdA/CDA1 family)
VSFTFDDFPRTAYTTGGEILKSHQATGTYYVALGLMNSVSAFGEHFGPDDLRSLVADGHDLSGHTFSHVSCQRTSTRKYVADVCKGQEALEAFSGPAQRNDFSYPYGHVTLAVKRALESRTRSCRGIRAGINGPTVDLNLLRANSLYSPSFDIDAIQRLILENEKRAGWLIFYTHDVRPNPSSFGCKPLQLEAVVRFASRRGMRIRTVAQTLADIGASPVPNSAGRRE